MSKSLGCGGGCFQIILSILNVLFLLLGIGIMAIGIYIKVDDNLKEIFDFIGKNEELSAGTLNYLAIILIGGGVITVLIALLGCAGAVWRSPCVLYLYAFILIILLIIELVAAILAAVYKSKLEDVYKDTLEIVFTKTMINSTEELRSTYEDLENTLECCGVQNITDYVTRDIPLSPYCSQHRDAMGCGDKIINIFTKNLPIIGGVLGGVVFLELFTLIAAIVLARKISNADDEDNYIPPPKSLSHIRQR